MEQLSVSIISQFEFVNHIFHAPPPQMISETRKGKGLKRMQTTRPGLMHEGDKQLRKNINMFCLHNYSLEQYLRVQGHI